MCCVSCLEKDRLELEQRARDCQMVADETQTKLLTVESQKAQLADSLRRKELLVADLENQVLVLGRQLDEARGLRPASRKDATDSSAHGSKGNKFGEVHRAHQDGQ
jgi:hypothetical protein